MNENEIKTHELTHDNDTPLCALCVTPRDAKCKEGHPIEGHEIRIGGFDGDGPFHLTYAGWDDQWLVVDADNRDMLRCGLEETPDYLVHGEI